jgi:hypothetical protein
MLAINPGDSVSFNVGTGEPTNLIFLPSLIATTVGTLGLVALTFLRRSPAQSAVRALVSTRAVPMGAEASEAPEVVATLDIRAVMVC